MKFNKYQCSFNCKSCMEANIGDIFKNVKATYLQKVTCQNFFKCFCQTICGTVKRLDIHGFLVQKQIGRNLQDVDIPALLIFLMEHQEITNLNLANNNITDYGFISLLDHIIKYKNIKELDVQNNNITNHGIRYLKEIGRKLELKILNLKANKFNVEASQNAALFLLENKHIHTFNVADVNQTASSLIYFMMVLSSDQENSNKTLRVLNISRPNPGCMYFFDSAHFADVIGHMLKHNNSLTALHLQKYNFSCHDIESMMLNIIYNNSLHLLDLACNNIGNHGIDYIARWLVKGPALKVLILARNIITDHGARCLSFAVPFSKLLALDISYNKITDDGMVSIMYTLKKTPLLRQLWIFGNCIGHPVAKIVKRMLLSKVLNQENIDVRPYRVDHRWYFARYDGECCRKGYDDIPYGLSAQVPEPPSPLVRNSRNYCKYNYTSTTELMFKHSTMSIISKTLGKEHIENCKCCYCLKCQAPHYDEECRRTNHSDTCTCCKCKGDESSDWSVDKSVLQRVAPCCDPMQNIEHILKYIDSNTKRHILRWINIDKQVLEEDLKLIGDPNASKEKFESPPSCTCSWMQLNISTLQKYLQESASRDVLIIPKDYNECCTDSSNHTSLHHCTNTK